ncbi:DUF3987 domain-containing protein [Burkholderia sp. Bp9002]|nr:DUF3987 domain-containing protein [Burkholderia sp. Bp9002]
MPLIVPETEVRYEFPKWPDHLPYPLETFPPIMRHAIKEVSDCLGAPVPLAASAALGAVSLACQNFVNVQCPGYEPSSCSLFLWTIAESSRGKSEVERRFLRAVHQFEESEENAVDAGKSRFAAELKFWQEDEKDLEKQYRKAKSVEEKERIKNQRLAHADTKPQERRARVLLYTDSTPQQLTEALGQFGAIGLMCADAGDVVKIGETFRQTTLLNGLWSGERRRSGLVGGDRATKAPRLTVSMMLQESEFRAFVEQRRGRAAVGNGLWARFLIAQPSSLWGTPSDNADEHYLDEFNARMTRILEQAVPSGAKRETLTLSKDAQLYWKCYRDAMKKAAGDLRRTTAERNFLLKLAQQASRIAALFHYFSRDDVVECIGSGSSSAAASEVKASATVALLRASTSDDHTRDSGEPLPAQSEAANRPTESRVGQADETEEVRQSQFDGSGLDESDRLPVQAGEANERTAGDKSLVVTLLDRAGRADEIADGSPEIHANQPESSAEATTPPHVQSHTEPKIELRAAIDKAPDEISGQTMLDAISLCEWFMCEYGKVMGRQEPPDQAIRRADPPNLNDNGEKLLGWVYRHYDRIAAEKNNECIKIDYQKFQNAFTRMGRENILVAMEWLGRQQGFRLEYGPRGGMYLCCSRSGNFCNGCKSVNAHGQPNFSDDRAMQYAGNASVVNGNSPSFARQHQVDASEITSGHGASNFVDSMAVVAPNEVNTDSRYARNQVRENQGAIGDGRSLHDRWMDAAAGELCD